MGPGEEGELPHVVAFHQGEDEPHKTDDVPVPDEMFFLYDTFFKSGHFNSGERIHDFRIWIPPLFTGSGSARFAQPFDQIEGVDVTRNPSVP